MKKLIATLAIIFVLSIPKHLINFVDDGKAFYIYDDVQTKGIKHRNYKPAIQSNPDYISVIMEVTAYTLNECGKSVYDKNYGITASGKSVRNFHTVASSRSLPFGTRLKIPEFDKFIGKDVNFVVEDRGGAIQGNKIDVYVGNAKLANEWGRRKVKVIIEK